MQGEGRPQASPAGAASARPPVPSAGAVIEGPSSTGSGKRKGSAPGQAATATRTTTAAPPPPPSRPMEGGGEGGAGDAGAGLRLFRIEPPHVAPLLALVPESVMANLLGFLPGESISNFSTTCRAALPFLHCVPALILTNVAAFPSFARRMRDGEGVRHLASLAFERLEGLEDGMEDEEGLESLPEEQRALLATVADVLAALVAHAHKLPNLKTLDLGEVIVTEPQQIKGLHRLASVVSLTYPRFQSLPGLLQPGETLATRAAARRQREIEYHILLEAEVAEMPSLKDLHLGALRWNILAETGFFPPPASPDGQDQGQGQGTVATSSSAGSGSSSSSASASRARKGVIMWRGRLRSMDCSNTLGMCDEYLRRLINYYRTHHMHELERLNLSFDAPSQVEQFTDVRPLAAAFQDGLFANLQCLDLSFQVSVTSASLAALTRVWCEQSFPSLKYLRLRDMGIGNRDADEEEEEDEGEWVDEDDEGDEAAGQAQALAQPQPLGAAAAAAAHAQGAPPVVAGQAHEQEQGEGDGGQAQQQQHEEEDHDSPYAALAHLSKAMQRGHLRGLVELDLQDNFLSLPGTLSLATGLMTPGALPCLETLDLTMGRDEFSSHERAYGAMRWSGCAFLCRALDTPGVCPRLRRLGLGGHLIGRKGVRALCVLLAGRGEAEQPCPMLEELDMTSNGIGDDGARYLAEWLRSGRGTAPRLRRLMLGDNNITGAAFVDAGVGAASMNPNSGLTVLNLERNWLGRAEADGAVSGLLRAFMGPSIRHLSLARNCDLAGGPHGAAEVGQVLRDFPWLEGLDLKGCGRARHLGVNALLEEWQGQRDGLQAAPKLALTSLDLRRNHLGAASLSALLQAAPLMPRLSELELDGHGTTCSHMLEALLRALQRGELPALLSLTFTCLRVSNREAWRQNEIASRIEQARPWLKAYISWPVPGEEGYSSSEGNPSSSSSSLSASSSSNSDEEEEEEVVVVVGAEGVETES